MVLQKRVLQEILGVVNVVEPNILEKKMVDPVNVENTVVVEHVSVFNIIDVTLAATPPDINVLTFNVDASMYPNVIVDPIIVQPVRPLLKLIDEPITLFPASVLT